MTDNYRSIKFKLDRIVRNPQLSDIIDAFVQKECKIIFEGMNLLNNFVFYCLDNSIPVTIDTTLIRQCCMMIIDPDTKIGRTKTNFKEPDFTGKTDDEINVLTKNFEDMKARYLEVGTGNRNRVATLKLVYNDYFPKNNLEHFTNETCI